MATFKTFEGKSDVGERVLGGKDGRAHNWATLRKYLEKIRHPQLDYPSDLLTGRGYRAVCTEATR